MRTRDKKIQKLLKKSNFRIRKKKGRLFLALGTSIVTTAIFLAPVNNAIQKHQFVYYNNAPSNHYSGRACDSNTHSRVATLWLKAGTSISFSAQGSITANQFINDDSNNKQYSMIERGSTCYMPSSSYTGWIFVALVIENHQSLSDTCSVRRIITTSYLETCTGSPPALETFITLDPSGTYDEIPKSAKLVFDPNNLPEKSTHIHVFTLTSAFTLNSIDEDFMEMLVLKVQFWDTRFAYNI